MRTIQSKFIVLILTCVLASTAVVSLIAFTKMSQTLQEDAAGYLKSVCNDTADDMDHSLEEVEMAVQSMYRYACTESGESDPDASEKILWKSDASVRDLSCSQGEATAWCVRTYLLSNPEMTEDFYNFTYEMSEDQKMKELDEQEQYAFQTLDENEIGRYRMASESKKACWSDPFYDETVGKDLIAYVVPFVYEDVCYGVIGMDVDLTMLREVAGGVSVYSEGSACIIAADGNIIYHKDHKEGCERKSLTKEERDFFESIKIGNEKPDISNYHQMNMCVISKGLRNGMEVCLLVPIYEIAGPGWKMLSGIVLATLVCLFAVTGVSIFLTRMLLIPLRRLAENSGKVVDGQYEIPFETEYQDEVGAIAGNLEKIVEQLQYFIAYEEKHAHRDTLTGVMNRQAYENRLSEIDKQIKNGEAAFGVVTLDINGLSEVNDEEGHEMGDLLVQDAAFLMKKVYGDSNVYRISGDIFVAILETTELMEYHCMSQVFLREVERFNRVEHAYHRKLSVARGVAIFEKRRDGTYADVYRRAENIMNQNKKWIKGQA